MEWIGMNEGKWGGKDKEGKMGEWRREQKRGREKVCPTKPNFSIRP